ncbi:MAG: phospholipid/cholesterol/gamma-HCH transport system substrate-binding protein, partial [Thermoleophilaceae bacterium]|nr:phospholipid/cholesterol/gamma-HCH transport system substrate-binding protein [Thermoleophilaceae bacterium]
PPFAPRPAHDDLMQKTAPSFARLAGMALFALSCFGILLFLWKSFGGPSPLAPTQYRFSADFAEATQLADGSDVRISGVKVGRVVSIDLSGRKTHARIEIERRYAPIPRDTRAILRQKTLLGETYVELSPGHRSAGSLPDGGALPPRQILSTVQLDEITRSLDPRTRRDLQRLLGSFAVAVNGRGRDLNDALGNLGPFATDTNDLLTILNEQHGALRRVVRDTGTVLDSVSRRQGDLSGLIVAGDRVLGTTAARNRDLADAVRILPVTLAELRPTLDALRHTAIDAAPVVHELRPAARSLGPALTDAEALAPDLQGLFGDLDRVVSLSRAALPALTRTVNAVRPVMHVLVPTLQQAYPVVQYLGLYKQEIVSALANLAASTQGSERPAAGAAPLHYIRALVPFTSEGAVVNARRYGTNRHNPYFAPLAMLKLASGLESFDCQNAGNPGSGEPAPPCKVQQPLQFQGRRTAYPHVSPGR